MALVPLHCKFPYKEQGVPLESLTRWRRALLCKKDGFSSNTRRRFHTDMLMKKTNRGVNHVGGMFSNRGSLGNKSFSEKPRKDWFLVVASSESNMTEKQLGSLDSYFEKLEGGSKHASLESSIKTREHEDVKVKTRAKEELESLNVYLGKINKDTKLKDFVSSTSDVQTNEGNSVTTRVNNLSEDNQSGSQRFQALRHYGDQYDETSDLYLIGILASINIAVFLFELASPIKNNEFGLLSLPLLYGAKINDLIMVGEWWRLVTPMFLHSGFFHVALSCWSLLTFGPQVCRGYGLFTFFLIFMLGGISGNITSFLHTPFPTVGGTGPVFAIIGAWLIYQMQNKHATEKDVSEDLFQKAIIATGLSFILSHFGPIDDWTHLGAVLAGVSYGFFTCPILQLDNSSTRTGQEEGIAVVRRNADPCKSLLVFAIFVLVLASSLLLFAQDPQLEILMSDDFVLSLIWLVYFL